MATPSLPNVFSKGFSKKLKDYQEKFQNLLDLEFSVDDLMKSGQVLDQLYATPVGKLGHGVVIEVSDKKGRPNYFHQSKFCRTESIVLSQKSTNV